MKRNTLSMDRQTLKHLQDIYSSILEIEEFLCDRPKEFATFCNDTLLRRGIERNIEIMGEAMNRILKTVPDITITSARKIVDTRNFVIHAYDSLRPDILWSIVINNLPLLKQEIEILLKG